VNKISGRVVLKGGAGISDLLVVIHDLDPDTKPEEQIPGTPSSAVLSRFQGEGDRLGCVLTRRDDTGREGYFELTYDDPEYQIRNPQEKRPDLLLSVWAPEEPGLDPRSRLLYTSNAIRQNAGRTEEYLIRLNADQLLKAGVTPPSAVAQDAEPAENVLTRLKENTLRQGSISDGSIEIARERMDLHRTRFAGFHEVLKPSLVASLSNLSADSIAQERFVALGESPFEKNKAIIQQGIRETINTDDPAKRAPARGLISLSVAEVQELRAQADADGAISEAAIKKIAAANGQTARTTFLQAIDRLARCRLKTADTDCAAALLNPPTSNPGGPPPIVPAPGKTAIGSEDIPRYLARLMEPMTAPEEQLLVGLMPVATREAVQSSIQSLVFRPSPADVPAVHYFNSLQIAFEYVWQEAIDQGLLDLAQDAYETIVELGGDPTRREYKTHGPVKGLLFEGRATLKANRSIVVRDHRGETPGSHRPPPAPGGWTTDADCPDANLVVRDHRTGAVRIAGNEGVRSDDPTERLPALLQELEKRLLQKYSFTVYAANSKERSVNFGIFNVYSDTWTPDSYQPGPMVKSIPLAPKQSQKIVITRKTSKKRSSKELEKHLSVTKDETSQTSRAEQEIARRAQSKTNFSVENQASENTLASSASTTIRMSQEASKSSDDIKKSMHEAVFRSAQEVTQERVTELHTEEVEDAEISETTEISNPNDEIALTYLFYELQRRYRIHQRLYRVLPVVLVAQEFPEPHEINQAWLVAHDWILKRTILDDSFLPTLSSLSQSAGNETALAEIRTNVQQQRCIVRQLRQELTVANQRAALQRQLLERSVLQKAGAGGVVGIVEDAAGALGGIADSIGDFIFGGGGGESQNNREAVQERAQDAADQARDLLYRLEREVTALNALTETYTKTLREHHTHLTEIARLENHVRDNIMAYMHAVWDHEPRDQRYFRLHNVPIPTFKTTSRHFHIDFDGARPTMLDLPHTALPRFGGREAKVFPLETKTTIASDLEFAPLSQVADLDNLLGYKGNYMIFPLLESNPLTDFMMDPYIDRATGQLVDPSDPLNWSIDEFSQYVCCLKETLTAEELEALLPQLKETYKAVLSNPTRNDDILVVPTNSLFVELLPGETTGIETYKAAHRKIDVDIAAQTARMKALENVRLTARLLASEHDDPNVDQRVLIQGDVPSVVVPPPEH
jgi:hypothetical protein